MNGQEQKNHTVRETALRVKRFMEAERMPGNEPAHIIVGVSGGADSTALLLLLHENAALTLTAVHIHHGIRGEEAEGDLAFVENLCAELAIPLVTRRFDIPALAAERGKTLEEMGREIRYRTFEEIREEVHADCIAVAHHRDDSAETILMQLLRGSGLRGMLGISPVSGRVIRPLLCLTREEIEAYLTAQGRTWRTDSTNLEDGAMRNRIRRELIPLIKERIQPSVREVLLADAENLKEAEHFLREKGDEAYGRFVRLTEEGDAVLAAGLSDEADAVKSYVIRAALEMVSESRKDWERVHVLAVRELFSKQTGRRLDLPMGISAVREYGGVRIGRKGKDPRQMPSMTLEEMSREAYESRLSAGKTEGEADAKMALKPYTKAFDYDKINSCPILRTRMPGDRITVYRDGRAKKLQDYLVDAKVPSDMRDRIPLVADGSEILWVVGYRVSERCRVTEETKRVLLVTVTI